MVQLRMAVPALTLLLATACATTSSGFVSSWKSPTAKPIQVTPETKVAAVVMMGDDATRRSAEDKLAAEISSRGAKGIPMYTLMPEGKVDDEEKAKEVLRSADVQGVVVIRPTPGPDNKTVDYSVPPYSNYWNSGYYAHGWGQPWISPEGVPYDYVVTVDTLIYSLTQNQLIWAGKSKKTNPASLNALVTDLADDTAEELRKQSITQK